LPICQIIGPILLNFLKAHINKKINHQNPAKPWKTFKPLKILINEITPTGMAKQPINRPLNILKWHSSCIDV
jgi:hypothetical protein